MFAVNAGRPSLNRSSLPTYSFGANSFRCVHAHLQSGTFNLDTAIDFAVPFIRDDRQLRVRGEMVEKIEVVLAPAVQVIKHNPIVRSDVHEPPSMRNCPIT